MEEVEGGERKLPANYVSLAQLQERWLRKQEEKKVKEEETKLKEEEDKRERAARAHAHQNEKEKERGFVRAMPMGVVQVQDKGKGKEIVGGGPGEINKPKFINKRSKKRKIKRVMAISSGEGGSGGGVEEIGNVCVVEVLPITGENEIAHANKTGFRKNGIYNKGSSRVNELKQSDVALGLEKEKEEGGENDHGMKWKERGRYREEEGGRNGWRVNELKQSEVALNLEKEKEDGKNDHSMKLKERGRYRGEERRRNGGTVSELKQSEVAIDLNKEKEEEKEAENDHGMQWKERGWRDRGEERGRIGGYLNRKKEYRPVVVLRGNEVNSKLENKAEDRISEVCSQITSLNVGDRKGIRGGDNKAKADVGVEGLSLNGNKVAVESEKKVDHAEVLARKSENFGRGYQTNGNRRGGFGRGNRTRGKPWGGYERDRRYTRPQISDRKNSTESAKVWVKKEDKLDA